MAIALNDVIQFTEFNTYVEQTWINVYYLECTFLNGAVSYSAIADHLIDAYWTQERRDLTHISSVYDDCEIRNATNQIDFYSQGVAEAGNTSTSEGMPPYVTATMRLIRSTLLTRNGYKRYSGIPEGNQNEGRFTGGALAQWNLHAAILATPQTVIDGLNSCDLTPVIVGVSGTPPVRDFTKLNPIQTAFANEVLGTQNTRKISTRF